MNATTKTPIACPDWCTVPTAEHVADLDGWEGAVLHHGDFRAVELSTCTDPAGDDLEPPQLSALGATLSIVEAKVLFTDLGRALLEVDPAARKELGR